MTTDEYKQAIRLFVATTTSIDVKTQIIKQIKRKTGYVLPPVTHKSVTLNTNLNIAQQIRTLAREYSTKLTALYENITKCCVTRIGNDYSYIHVKTGKTIDPYIYAQLHYSANDTIKGYSSL